MKWVDYREKLGIGFNDEHKTNLLKNAMRNLIGILSSGACYSVTDYRSYSIMTGEPFYTNDPYDSALTSFEYSRDMRDLISKCVAFCNTYSDSRSSYPKKYPRTSVIAFIRDQLENFNIAYDFWEDEDGIFIFPKGAKELDSALVSEPLQWLKRYPGTHSVFVKALKTYSNSNQENASEVADSFRKALECFFHEYFGGNKSLENYISDYGTYLKNHNIPAEISDNLRKTLDAYTKFNNNYAKHQDNTAFAVLEYIMYETGNIIRLLITLKQSK